MYWGMFWFTLIVGLVVISRGYWKAYKRHGGWDTVRHSWPNIVGVLLMAVAISSLWPVFYSFLLIKKAKEADKGNYISF